MGKRKKKSKSAKVVASNKKTDSINQRIIFITLVTITLLIVYILVKDNFSSFKFPSFTNFFNAAEKIDTASQTQSTENEPTKHATQLVRKNADGTTTTLATSGSSKSRETPALYKWQDYLIVNQPKFTYDLNNQIQSGEIVLKSYNLDTGETKEIFKSSDDAIVRDDFDIVAVMGNKMYFTYTAYLSKNPIYVLDLPPTQPAIALSSSFNGVSNFFNANGSYFVSKGVGDGCGGFTEYAAFDSTQNYLSRWIRSSAGCQYGEQSFGFDSSGALISSSRIADPNDQGSTFIGRYTNVTRVFPWSPEKKEIILDASLMPKNVKHMYFSPKIHSMIMIGDSVTILNTQTKLFSSIAATPANWNYNSFLYIYGYDGTNVCVRTTGNYTSLWTISGNVITDTKQTCEPEKDLFGTSLGVASMYSDNKIKSLEEQVSSLNLPSNYEVIHQ